MDILLSDVSKSFGEKQLFSNFSHRFPHGETTCVQGPSGCGKTTLLRMVCGLADPDSGKIETFGAKFAVVFQEDRLFETLSAEKNVLLCAKQGFSRQDAHRLLSELGIDEYDRKIAAFSGGMRRRVALARALAADWDVLLLDEPMTGLDEKSRLSALNVVKKMTAQRTVICVTHAAEDAAVLGGHILSFIT